MAWASHLGIPAIFIPLESYDCDNLANWINRYLQQLNAQIVIKVPLGNSGSKISHKIFAISYLTTEFPEVALNLKQPPTYDNNNNNNNNDNDNNDSDLRKSKNTWEAWNKLRTLCDFNNRLSVGKKKISLEI